VSIQFTHSLRFTGIYTITAEQAFVPGEIHFRKTTPAGLNYMGWTDISALAATVTLCNKFFFIKRPGWAHG
jgi:hypothetical protein